MRIRSGPLELRLPVPADAEALFALASDEQLTRYLQWPAHRTVEESRAYIDDARSLWQRRVAFLPCIYLDGTELAGAIGISHLDHANARGEVGTWLGRRYQGRGFNRYAKAAIFRFGFEILGLHRLELIVRADNDPSRVTVERLPGVVYEGLARSRLRVRGASHDAHMYAITSAAWDPTAWPAVEISGALP